MKDFLQDLIQHTQSLGIIDLIRVNGTDKETDITAIAEDKSVIVLGKFKTPIPEFEGVFGMPNLNKLQIILGFDEYDDKAKVSVARTQKDGVDTPSTIHFETVNSDFVNDYRLMAKVVVEDKVKNFNFKGATWNVEFEPSVAGILRLKKQANANAEEGNFTLKTDKGDLKIYFGDPSTHSANFVFHAGVSGTLSRAWMWPVKQFISIMNLTGDKVVRISDQGAAQITVDSGIAEYTYLLPAQSK
jgi:hypothetical protein